MRVNKKLIIANRIKQAREELGLSQSDLAQQLHYANNSMISRIENGKISVSADKIIDFSAALNKPILYFLGDI